VNNIYPYSEAKISTEKLRILLLGDRPKAGQRLSLAPVRLALHVLGQTFYALFGIGL
jgi:hypothetical protein